MNNTFKKDDVIRLDFKNKFVIERSGCCIRLNIYKAFRNKLKRDELSGVDINSGNLEFCACDSCTSAVRQVVRQIHSSIDTGIIAEKYFECKVLELLFLQSLDDTKRCGDCKKKALSPRDEQTVYSVKEIIDARIHDCPMINELARMTNTSKSKLQGDFKTTFGQTIHEYLQSARMKRARELIDNTDFPIYIIASEVGCKKAGRFAEVFKKTYGMTPTEYRRSLIG